MSAISITGHSILVGDNVSILGVCTGVSGTAQPLTVTIQPPLSTTTFMCSANDCQATQHSADANHTARSVSGKPFGPNNDDVTVLGECTAISGSGNTAILSVLLKSSGLTVSVPAGACTSSNSGGQF